MRDFTARSSEQWQAVKALDSSKSIPGWPDDDQREAFQLVAASVLYLDNSLHRLGSLHTLWRVRPESKGGAFFPDGNSPVSIFSGLSKTIGQMHLASAVFRLPVALQKTVETHPGAETAFGNLWGPSARASRHDWRRPNMTQKFPRVKTLKDCATGVLGGTAEERLQHAMTIITIVRDDFGHGEEGDSRLGDYAAGRDAVVDALYTCRIVQAAQLLMGWALEKLKA